MKITVNDIKARKSSGSPLVMLTSYDYPTARIEDRCAIDIQLVGDSVGTNVLGYDDIRQVTIEDMVHHTKAVARGVKRSFILSDMPYDSFNTPDQALTTAKTLLSAGCDGVKIEGEKEILPQVEKMVANGIAVCGHIGYTPQKKGKVARVQGKSLDEAVQLIDAARHLEKAGVFAVVLELVPQQLAQIITQAVSVPTVGIGAGPFCDGQVQVVLDILGINDRVFRHARAYDNFSHSMERTFEKYSHDVMKGDFPSSENSVNLTEDILGRVKKYASSQSW